MNETGAVTLEQVVSLARQLPPLEKIRLIEQIAPEIERDMLSQRPLKRKSLLGLCADLGSAPSAKEIDEVRREMWADFPREDMLTGKWPRLWAVWREPRCPTCPTASSLRLPCIWAFPSSAATARFKHQV